MSVAEAKKLLAAVPPPPAAEVPKRKRPDPLKGGSLKLRPYAQNDRTTVFAAGSLAEDYLEPEAWAVVSADLTAYDIVSGPTGDAKFWREYLCTSAVLGNARFVLLREIPLPARDGEAERRVPKGYRIRQGLPAEEAEGDWYVIDREVGMGWTRSPTRTRQSAQDFRASPSVAARQRDAAADRIALDERRAVPPARQHELDPRVELDGPDRASCFDLAHPRGIAVEPEQRLGLCRIRVLDDRGGAADDRYPLPRYVPAARARTHFRARPKPDAQLVLGGHVGRRRDSFLTPGSGGQ